MGELTHCWKDYREHLADVHGWGTVAYWAAWAETWSDDGQESRNRTCMLPDGHEGDHVFTPDAAIGVSFEPTEVPPVEHGERCRCADCDPDSARERREELRERSER